LQNQISVAPAQAGAQCKAALCLSHTFLKIINSLSKDLIVPVLMSATCQTTEAALQAGSLPAQARRKERFEKVSAAFDYY
jgi:large-conductance mechanosensitive channel